VSPLEKQISCGELKLGTTDREVIETLLRRLQIPVESQLLVFSRTSFQREHIRPEHPRALYFNDHSYVGWVPGGLAQITTLDQHRQRQTVEKSSLIQCMRKEKVREFLRLFADNVDQPMANEKPDA